MAAQPARQLRRFVTGSPVVPNQGDATMLRYLPTLLPALLFLPGPYADAHTPLPVPVMRQAIVDDLPGTYSNESNGGSCYVERRGRGYVFTNENGSWAFFVPAGPNYLV